MLPGHVDHVARNLDHERGLPHLGLARQARLRLQAPGLVEQVFLFLGGFVERVEALAHDDVAGRARAGLLARVLDVDVVGEQAVADAGAGLGLDDGAVRAKLDVRQDDDLGHGTISLTLRPASADRMLWSMRRAAKPSVARVRCSMPALMARWSVPAHSACSSAMAASMVWRSSGDSSPPSTHSACCVASMTRSASTICSRSARASMSSPACSMPARSISAISSSDRP